MKSPLFIGPDNPAIYASRSACHRAGFHKEAELIVANRIGMPTGASRLKNLPDKTIAEIFLAGHLIMGHTARIAQEWVGHVDHQFIQYSIECPQCQELTIAYVKDQLMSEEGMFFAPRYTTLMLQYTIDYASTNPPLDGSPLGDPLLDLLNATNPLTSPPLPDSPSSPSSPSSP